MMLLRPCLAALETPARADTGRAPGEVVVVGGRPLHLRAVIHDLDRVPTWREEWIVRALLT
ncbi:MAG: hypothetical protein BRD57_03550, partial [Proteobacteria bacterium SW_6_67_9]